MNKYLNLINDKITYKTNAEKNYSVQVEPIRLHGL